MSPDLPTDISSIDEIIEISETYEERIDLLHLFAEQKVSHTLFLIDDAISAWEAAGKKPERLRKRIILLADFREAFGEWEKQSILSKRYKSIEKKLKILKEYNKLCTWFEKRLEAVGG